MLLGRRDGRRPGGPTPGGQKRLPVGRDRCSIDAPGGHDPEVRTWLPSAIRQRLDPAQRFGLRITLVGVTVFLLALPFTALARQVLRNGPLVAVDEAVALEVHGAMSESRVSLEILEAITFLGRPVWFLPVVALVGAQLWRRGLRRLATFVVVASAGGGLVNLAVKLTVNRNRPVFDEPLAEALGKSFPSGHAMGSTVVYGALLLVFLPALPRSRRVPVAVGTVVLVLAIGASRIGLGVHYLSDVVAGYLLGLAWLCGNVAAFRIWREERGRPAVSAAEGIEPEESAAIAR